MQAYTYTHTHTHTQRHAHTRAHTHSHTNTQHTHTHTHTHTPHTHHTYMSLCLFFLLRYGLQCVAFLLPLMILTWVIASLYVSFGNTVLGWIYLVLVVITVSDRHMLVQVMHSAAKVTNRMLLCSNCTNLSVTYRNESRHASSLAS